ncbi:KIN14B-interacting protein At4g14310 [Cornus florida]|uniref:KIN14B-interacting protein At4g14310 n=1 Tax=Cornus florida TaxID=4283 RepID=UPI00289AD0EC|nr:KIN14B-interacting protein At4g14310 [Cornus florida]
MSTSSVRRLKERGGGGGKVAAAVAKPSRTPNPVSDKLAGGETLKRSTGKENPRPTSRIRAAAVAAAAMSQKPVMRAMPRIEKPPGDDVETRVRWSTSSVQRGRSSSPSDFNRVLSDSRRSRVSGVSADRCEKGSGGEIERSVSGGGKFVGGIRVSEKIQRKKGTFRDSNVKANEGSENGIRVLKDCKDPARVMLSTEKSSEIRKEVLKPEGSENFRVRVLDDYNGDVNLSLISTKLESCNHVSDSDPYVKVSDHLGVIEESKRRSCVVLRSDDVTEKKQNGTDLGSKELGRKYSNNLNVKAVSLKEKGVIEEGAGAQCVNKYPSKLHEKLAFLEGKVKRIASDIKRTKEMLDMNNPDASKVIISDIHEKISGIEKAMGHAVNCSDGNGGGLRTTKNDDSRIKISEGGQSSVKGLNSEELEARLFPHHKLIRDRTSLKTLSGSSQRCQPNIVEVASEVKPEEKLLSSIDENPIALEFLASLNKEQSKDTMKDAHVGMEACEIQEMDDAATSEVENSSSLFNGKGDIELILTTNETLDEFDDQENKPTMMIEEETEDSSIYQLNEIGLKTSTGGWFVSEGESVLLTHNDGSCSFYDVANCEEKSEYRPPIGVSPNVWRDCWIIRAPGADGCSGRYVVAASAGNTMDSGFCSWDFYTKDVRAFHIEDGNTSSRPALAPLPNNTLYNRNASSTIVAPENQQWWYKPCGPLIVSTASCQRVVRIYDIRDGEYVMKWEVQKPVLAMDYSSPLQWRNRGKVVLAEAETLSLWDVSSQNPQALLSVSSCGRKISALHVNNTDAEIGGGVRQRVSSSEAEGNDGVFCTPDAINVLDFRHPSGIGLKIPKLGVNVQSVFSRGDSILLGCTNSRSAVKKQQCPQVQHFSLRKQRLVSTYALPESNAHFHYSAITQVWGNSNLIMGVCGLGLFVFDALKDDGLQSFTMNYGNVQNVREIIGPDDMYSPSFDYLASRVLLISRDRPAQWRYLS